MNKLDKLYENMPEDFKDRRKKRKEVYSSVDYVPGIRGKLIKLLVSFIFYFLTISVSMVLLSLEMNISQMIYIIGICFVLIIGIWLISLTRCNNLIRILVALAILVPSCMFLPYKLGINIAIFLVYFFVTLSLLGRLKKPEKIALTPTLVIASDIIIGVLQLPFIFKLFNNTNSLEVRNLLLIIDIIWIILSLFIVNSININRITSNNSKTSKSILYGNLGLTVTFSSAILLLASFGSYKDIILNAIRSILLWLFSGSGKKGDAVIGMPEAEPMDLQELLGEGSKPSIVWKILEVALIIVMIAIGIFLIYYFGKKLIIAIKKGIICLYQYFGDKDDIADDVGRYDDEVESSFDKSEFSDSIRKRWMNFTKIFKKKQSLKDMKDNKQKVRFLYKALLRKSTEKYDKNINATAREFIKKEQISNEADVFLEGYEKARYSSHDVNNESVKAGMDMVGIKK